MQRFDWQSKPDSAYDRATFASAFPDAKGEWVKHADAEAYAEEKAREVVEYIEAEYMRRRRENLPAEAYRLTMMQCRAVFSIRPSGAGPAPSNTASVDTTPILYAMERVQSIFADAIRALQERANG